DLPGNEYDRSKPRLILCYSPSRRDVSMDINDVFLGSIKWTGFSLQLQGDSLTGKGGGDAVFSIVQDSPGHVWNFHIEDPAYGPRNVHLEFRRWQEPAVNTRTWGDHSSELGLTCVAADAAAPQQPSVEMRRQLNAGVS